MADFDEVNEIILQQRSKIMRRSALLYEKPPEYISSIIESIEKKRQPEESLLLNYDTESEVGKREGSAFVDSKEELLSSENDNLVSQNQLLMHESSTTTSTRNEELKDDDINKTELSILTSVKAEESSYTTSYTCTRGRIFEKGNGIRVVQYPLYLAIQLPSDMTRRVKLSIIVSSNFESEPVDCLLVSNTSNLDCVSERDAYYCQHLTNNIQELKNNCQHFLTENCSITSSQETLKLRNGGVYFHQIPNQNKCMAHVFISDDLLRPDNTLLNNPDSLRGSTSLFSKRISYALKHALSVIDKHKCNSICFCPFISPSGIGQFSCHEADWLWVARAFFYAIFEYCNDHKSTSCIFDYRMCVESMDQGLELKKVLDKDVMQLILSRELSDNKFSTTSERDSHRVPNHRHTLTPSTNTPYAPSVRDRSISEGVASFSFKTRLRDRFGSFQISSPFSSSKERVSSVINEGVRDIAASTTKVSHHKDPYQYYDNYAELQFINEAETNEEEGIEYVEHTGILQDTSEGDLIQKRTMNNGRDIKWATVPKLIEKLTTHESFDSKFMYAFLLTYRTFISSSDLLDALISRYNTPPPVKNISHEEFSKFYSTKLSKIRMRVSQVLRKWIEDHFNDFSQDEGMMAKCSQFAELMKRTKGEVYASQIQNALRKKISASLRLVEEPEVAHLFENEKRVSTENSDLLIVLSSDLKHLAAQITVLEHHMFSKVRESELINKNWSKTNREELAPHIFHMVQWFNRFSNYVASRILIEMHIENRKTLLEYFINLAYELLLLNNYNGVFEVCSGLQSSSVYRLKRTWMMLDPKIKQKFDLMMKIISHDNNFANLRKAVLSAKLPCLPYIGIYLTDLTFFEDGNSDEVDGKINFVKRRKLAGVISDLKMYQQTTYQLQVDEQIRKMLTNLIVYIPLKEMYNRSLTLEPREMKQQHTSAGSPRGHVTLTCRKKMLKEARPLMTRMARNGTSMDASKAQSFLIRCPQAQAQTIPDHTSMQYAHYSSFFDPFENETVLKLNQYDTLEDIIKAIDEAMATQAYPQAKDLLSQLEATLSGTNVEEFENWDDKDEFFLSLLLYVRWNLASAHFNTNNWNDALHYCDQILGMENILRAVSRLDEAFMDLNRACSMKAEALTMRDEPGDIDKALKLRTFLIDRRLRKKIKSDHDKQKVLQYKKELRFELLMRGRTLVSLNELDEAMKDANEILKMSRDSEALVLKGHIHYLLSQHEEACDTLQQVLHRDADSASMREALLIMAYSRTIEFKFNEAILLCNQLIDANRDEVEALMLRGSCYQKLNNCEYALIDFKACVQIDPERLVDVLPMFGSTLHRLLRYDELLQLSEQYTNFMKQKDRFATDDFEWLTYRVQADVLYGIGQYEKGYNYYIQKLQPLEDKLSSNMLTDFLDLRIEFLTKMGKFEEAKQLAEKCVKHAADVDPEALFYALQSRAVVHAHLGQYELAHDDIKQCEDIFSTLENSYDKEPQLHFLLYKAKVMSRMPGKSLDSSLQLFEEVLHMANKYTYKPYVIDTLEDLIELEIENGLNVAASKHVQELLGHLPNHTMALRTKEQLLSSS